MLNQPKLLDRTQLCRFKLSGVRCGPRGNMLGKRCGPGGKNLGCPSRRRKRGIKTHVNMRWTHGLIACARPILRIAARQRCQTCHKIGSLLPRIMLGVRGQISACAHKGREKIGLNRRLISTGSTQPYGTVRAHDRQRNPGMVSLHHGGQILTQSRSRGTH